MKKTEHINIGKEEVKVCLLTDLVFEIRIPYPKESTKQQLKINATLISNTCGYLKFRNKIFEINLLSVTVSVSSCT